MATLAAVAMAQFIDLQRIWKTATQFSIAISMVVFITTTTGVAMLINDIVLE